MALAFSPDGTLLATGSSDETTRIWEAATGAVRAILIGHRGPARRVAFSSDSTLLATMDNRCMLRIWDAGVGTSRATRTDPIWGAALAPYGKLRTFGYEAASILATVKYEGDGVAFSPDGALLAAFGDGSAVRIWDAVTDAHRITLKNHRGLLRAVAFITGNP
jgi:WD40 repeat protein